MKKENIFFLKDFVDFKIPKNMDIVIRELEENLGSIKTEDIVDEFIEKIKKLEDDDFIEVMIGTFIPDNYRDQGRREKLFTKLSEVVVGEWWNRIGGERIIPTLKSGTEDVELIYLNKSIVCDAKVFRLGRSQKAPNVKDFLKAASVRIWMDNLVERYKKEGKAQECIGGMVTYSSIHEWAKSSEVYQECTNKELPIVMLPYEILALLLKNRGKYKIEEFLKLWNYNEIFINQTKDKKKYWEKIENFMIDLIGISKEIYIKSVEKYRNDILDCVYDYENLIKKEIKYLDIEIEKKLNSFSSIDDLKMYAKKELSSYVKEESEEYLRRINKFRRKI